MQYTVSAKLIRRIELTLISTGSVVKMNNEYTEEFKVEYNIKQGDHLSATLYSVVADVILCRCNITATRWKRKYIYMFKQCSAYADDMLITRRSKQSLMDTFQNLKVSHYILDLLLISKKTKYIKMFEERNWSE